MASSSPSCTAKLPSSHSIAMGKIQTLYAIYIYHAITDSNGNQKNPWNKSASSSFKKMHSQLHILALAVQGYAGRTNHAKAKTAASGTRDKRPKLVDSLTARD